MSLMNMTRCVVRHVNSVGSITPPQIPSVSLNVRIINKYSYCIRPHNIIDILQCHGTDPHGWIMLIWNADSYQLLHPTRILFNSLSMRRITIMGERLSRRPASDLWWSRRSGLGERDSEAAAAGRNQCRLAIKRGNENKGSSGVDHCYNCCPSDIHPPFCFWILF